jgi:hypothetical protein
MNNPATFSVQLKVCCSTARVQKFAFTELESKVLDATESFAIANALIQMKKPNKIQTIVQRAKVKLVKGSKYLSLLKYFSLLERNGLLREIHGKFILTSEGKEAFENRLLGVVGAES